MPAVDVLTPPESIGPMPTKDNVSNFADWARTLDSRSLRQSSTHARNTGSSMSGHLAGGTMPRTDLSACTTEGAPVTAGTTSAH
jgi:hypothetical protein